MKKTFRLLIALLVFVAGAVWETSAQSTTGVISGIVADQQNAVIANATVIVRNLGTNESRTAGTDSEGRYRLPNLPIGNYEITFQAKGFAKYLRTGVELLVNQEAVVNISLKPSTVEEVVTVTENASLLNTTNAEVSTRFDSKRLSELPLAPNRDIMNVALSAAGISQLGSGQSTFASGAGGPGTSVNYSANGMRLRSNNFVIDGQDSNDPSVTGAQQPLNNPDLIQEVRLVTNQFTAEYGRAAGSVFNVVTKSGTNNLHGSGFWFNNNNRLNACSNLEKAANPGGACRGVVNGVVRGTRDGAPLRIENQFGGTLGGPIIKDKTFFFGSYQRWTDRQLLAGFTIAGAPTEAGKQILQQQAGSRPQVAALLKFLPAATSPNGTTFPFTLNGQTFNVPVGSVTGANTVVFNNHQWSTRIDHRFNEKHSINGRFFFNDQLSVGSGQATPTGLANVVPTRQQSVNIGVNSLLSSTLVNEFRVGYQRYGSRTTAQDPASETIPSIEVNQLGLGGFNAAASRTAIGLAVNLPQFRFNNTYQILDNLTWSRGSHAMKFGADLRRIQVKSQFLPTVRGRLQYATLDALVNDQAQASQLNRIVPGAPDVQYYNWYDYYFYAQDEWKVRPSFSLSYGLRYEAPGNSIASLVPVSDSIVRTTGDSRYALTPVPKRDLNNFQPRFGFSWNPRHDGGGSLGWVRRLTGGDRLVVRGGYSRTHDYGFININLNIASAFPFLFALSPSLNGAYANLLRATAPVKEDIPFITRTTVAADFRSPVADQYSLEVQRELAKNWVMRVGYIATRGTGLFQTVDGNPVIATRSNRNSLDPAFVYSPAPSFQNVPRRVDLTRGIIRERANVASSIYHSMQISLEKRLSRNFSMGTHYTWSAFIDDASEVFNPQPAGEIAVAQDPYNRRADRARSSYDRPHRFTGNVVYEFPFYREQKGVAGHTFGGWQTNAFFTLQSGTPFTVLNGADPAGVLQGIDGLVGNAIRPNLNTTLDLSRMNLIEIRAAGGASLFSALTAGQRTGNVGRNTLRADGIANLDFGIIKNTKVREGHQLQFRADLYNLTNTRNFGTPNSLINSGANFLNQWATNGGNRRVLLGLRYTF
ncbi:MAG TPA: carboxypeptidase regulatory-like domain-containing protein [Blastocatellia bacterium]|nr:carboxypeptidase regulatory-like domain-containing protein [Blastocatellia bacterium]HMZ22799.1 carboxypeptidase regulatory-like domain-containing protein [Blastocatellia bacterium]HNG34300.1 carboxypeptidase regulatory-like domain-containing protein [Blastocatellia bacterium]